MVNITNNFIQTKPENEKDKVSIRLRLELAVQFVIIAPEMYIPYVVLQKGKNVSYSQSQNSISETLKAPFLFYRKYIKDLLEFGFKINPYDVCIARKMVKKEMTMVFCVNNMKISHHDHQEITISLNDLNINMKWKD